MCWGRRWYSQYETNIKTPDELVVKIYSASSTVEMVTENKADREISESIR